MSEYSYRDQLPVGTRVRNVSEQFTRAYAEGTGTIEQYVKQHFDGTHEYLVRKDDGSLVSLNYVHPITPEDFR